MLRAMKDQGWWRGHNTPPVRGGQEKGCAVGLGMGGGKGSGTWWHTLGVSPPLHRVPCPCCGVDGAARGMGRTHGPSLPHGNVCLALHIPGAQRDIPLWGWSTDPCRGATRVGLGAHSKWLGCGSGVSLLHRGCRRQFLSHICTFTCPRGQPVQALAVGDKITSTISLEALAGASQFILLQEWMVWGDGLMISFQP